MLVQGREVEFPATLDLSFAKLLDNLEERAVQTNGAESAYYKDVLAHAEAFPELRTGMAMENFDNHREIIEELMQIIFPHSLTNNEIKGATVPWDFEPFYMSQRLKNLLEGAGEDFAMTTVSMPDDEKYISACSVILMMYYKRPVNISRSFYIKMDNQNTGWSRTFRIGVNVDFMDISPTPDAPEVTMEDYYELIDNFHDIDLWKRKFPPGSWTFSGFTLINMMDLTWDENINKLSTDLLSSGKEGFATLKDNLSALLQIDDLRLSFVNVAGDMLFDLADGSKKHDKMMMGSEEKVKCDSLLCAHSYNELIIHNRPIAFPNLDRDNSEDGSVFYKNLKSTGIKSYFASPIIFNGKNLGILELGSNTKGALNATTSIQLERVMPILAVAGNRVMEELSNKVEAIIQEECTSIHPSVKWRFAQEAMLHIQAQEEGEAHVWKDISFHDVYPLYGQLDIRSSSTIRNEAIRADLLTQLEGARTILSASIDKHPFPIYEELLFVMECHIRDLQTDMITASEQVILKFLHNEFDSILDHLLDANRDLQPQIESYKDSLNTDLNFVYQERKDFDDSVDQMNRHMADYLDKRQEVAQAMFPHYFERYKTDGVEFNMYVGESISQEGGFNTLLVNNLRLWQLMVMIEMEREVQKLQGALKKKLEVASLVLAYSTPLSINFRMDEKRFDVEGAYNARYEIVKKRIDKAHIKGTSERITAVRKLVVVYTREEDEREYLRYVRFLQSKGYLKVDGHEVVDVEDLQGVSGLRALRAEINYTPEHEEELSLEDIMQELEGEKT